MALLKQTLKIANSGELVRGGSITYSVDSNDGHITFVVNVEAHYLFLDHNHTVNGNYKIDPKLLSSQNLKVGQTLSIGPVHMKVTSRNDVRATADVNVDGFGNGHVIFKVTQPNLSIFSLEAEGKIKGFDFKLSAA